MKNSISVIMSALFVLVSPAFAQIVETHEFGATNTQYYIYSNYGPTFKFAAQNTMTVKTVEVKSWLATNSSANFHIELLVEDSLIAKWDQFIDRVAQYTEYFHTKQISYSLRRGDTIVYNIDGTGGYPAGGLRGINYVKLKGEGATGIEVAGATPAGFLLRQNYPNPFNPSTTIRYELPKAAAVSLKIFNALGQEVATLVNERKEAGYYQATWNANVPSGIYFYRLQAGEYLETKKAILLK